MYARVKKLVTVPFAALLSAAISALGLTAGCSGQKASGTADTAMGAQVAVPTFNADSAMANLTAQTSLGPRVPGTPEHAAAVAMLTGRLESLGAKVLTQGNKVTDIAGRTYTVQNIHASLNPEARRRILLMAHYDTRPWADADPDASNHSRPIPGANDGASGVAVILEILRVASQNPAPVGIDVLLTDAEDSGLTAPDDADMPTLMRYENSWCTGAQQWVQSPEFQALPAPEFGILLDMVGAPSATFHPEYFSMQYAPTVVEKIQAAAARAGASSYFPTALSGAINDDHVHLNQAGIPTANIIDTRPGTERGFNATWHTMADGPQNISPATLQAVGNTLLNLIYNE